MSICTLSNDQFNFEFRIDPTEVNWRYHLQTNDQLTVGGMVRYIMGLIIDDVTITVETGTGGQEEVKRIGDFVFAHMQHARKTGKTLRFQNYAYPWDMEVFIIDIGGLKIDGVTKNYKVNLTMKVIKNNLELESFEMSDLLGSMVEGITNIATVHTVTASDTLESIAERFYGDVETGMRMLSSLPDNEAAFNPDGTPIPGSQITIPYMVRDSGGNLMIIQPGGEEINPYAEGGEGVSSGTGIPDSYTSVLQSVLPWVFGNKSSMASE